jgi:hypothetical protein
MTDETGSRIYFTIDFMLTQIITTMGQVAFRRSGELAAGLNLCLVGVTIGTESFLMAGGAGKFRAGINLVPGHKIRSLVVECAPGIAMALTAVGQTLDRFRVSSGDAGGVCTGIQNTCHQWHHYNQYQFAICHS